MATVTFSAVNKSYGEVGIVHDLDLEIPDGSFTVLVGPSGCGKSTSLRMLAGLEPVTSGAIRIGDTDVTALEPKDRDIAMVFQNYALYPHLTVEQNIAFPLRAKKIAKKEARERAAAVAATLGLTAALTRKPKDLSGGQQQRVAIGRAIIREPAVFLFDEPLSNLDAKLRVETRTELLRIQRRLGITSLYVTHDQEEAMTLSDRMVVMSEGRIAQQGAPLEVYTKPASTFVAGFVGSPRMNLVPGVIEDAALRSADGLVLPVGDAVTRRSEPVTVGFRPEDLVVTPAGGTGSPAPTGRIALIEHLGPRAIVAVEVPGVTLVSVLDIASLGSLTEGAPVSMSVRTGGLHVFDLARGMRIAS
ncbi:sugar ABC transporter ATP-binding protein [Mycolicibacterium anyangense]|uniref:Trehalose import ATP-binding protein SugC n=1 Tax=Mycolicibacterium anyangense TaxID=1431246 RepID=A0A6N4W6B8_9MYCO|nr:sn-glycerol-3-phosphate ABC transporter ATP-binding protein UgpC [Mycolicibacterium anyangense]BBZ75657.1 sugar ABC transporter ATP-binding protein [Mycolicibacterium anyangense]